MLEKRVEKIKGYKTNTINLKPDLWVIGKCNTLPSACLVYSSIISCAQLAQFVRASPMRSPLPYRDSILLRTPIGGRKKWVPNSYHHLYKDSLSSTTNGPHD
jgi:hypothetical protein